MRSYPKPTTNWRTDVDKITVSRKALLFGIVVLAVFVLALTFAL